MTEPAPDVNRPHALILDVDGPSELLRDLDASPVGRLLGSR